MGDIENRQLYSQRLLSDLKQNLQKSDFLLAEKACLFATGSLGRLEASTFSDVDPCIVSLCDDNGDSKLDLLTEIRVKSDLVEAIEHLNLKDIDGDGKYLGQFTIKELIDQIGKTTDDSSNAFSTRLLMILEGRAVIQQSIFEKAVAELISAYWVDFDLYEGKFIPAYFTNDIIRLWRTFCINYEARTRHLKNDEKIKKKIKNYKLKHSRILTCYSAIIYLLWIYRCNNTVAPNDAVNMSKLAPLERLSFVRDASSCGEISSAMSRLLERYENFLQSVNKDERELEQEILDNRGYTRDDYNFGQDVFNAIDLVGERNSFHRLIVV